MDTVFAAIADPTRRAILELEPAPLRDVMRWASRYEQFWTERLDRVEAFFGAKRRRS